MSVFIGTFTMSNYEFSQLINKLDEHTRLLIAVDTRLTDLVGPDGRVKRLEQESKEGKNRLDAIEKRVWMFAGATAALGAAVHFLLDWFRGK